ncbi:MAG TPA: thermonuclease family protein [Aquihabitans sp.]|nr:thermonuclease family protein [Aquihabitans sp.]
MRARRLSLLPLAVGLVVGVPVACTSPRPPVVALPDGGSGLSARVVHVVDGDTVDVELAGATERVRLLGIDTPETVKPGHPIDCFGPEASARTKALLPAGTAVVLQRDTEPRDRYGRLLAYLWRRDDGLFVNGSLVDDGFADTLSIEPNVAHRSDLSARRAAARAEGRGMWGSCPRPG